MRQLTKQRKLLRRILTEIQRQADYNKASLDQINGYLWDSALPQPLPEDEGLQDSLLFLQELIEENGHTTLEQIWAYFLDERRQALVFVTEMMDRVDRQRVNQELDTFVDFLDPVPLSPLLRRGSLADQVLHFLNGGLPLIFPFYGSYQRPPVTYYRQFTEQKRTDQMYALEYYSELGIVEWTASEVANKLAATEPLSTEHENGPVAEPGRQIYFNYDRLLELVLGDASRMDFSFKVGVTCWLLLTQLDHGELIEEREQQRGISLKAADAPVRATELFECSVYFFLAGALADKQWSILKSPSHLSWVPCDRPGFVIDPHAEAKQPIFSTNLLRNLKGIRSFYYPLSKDYCLRLDPATNGMDVTFSPIRVELSSEQEVNAVNELTISVGKELVVSSDKRILEFFLMKALDQPYLLDPTQEP